MKIRYPLIVAIVILIIVVGLPQFMLPQIANVLGIIFLVCLGLIVYLILRNIFRAIKGAVTGTPAGDYQAEARKACEKVTPKPGKNATPPWKG